MVSWGTGAEAGGAYLCHRISLFLRGVVLGGARGIEDVFCEGGVEEGKFRVGLEDLFFDRGEHGVGMEWCRCLRN